MRKLILFLLTFGFIGFVHAGILGNIERSNVAFNYKIVDNTISTSSIAIDLSDTTTYPHDYTAQLIISSIRISIDKASNANGAVRIGVITRIDATNADVSYFFSAPFNRDTETQESFGGSFSPSRLKTKVKNGSTPFFFTSDIDTGNTDYQTDLTIPTSAGGLVSPAVGDIVVDIDRDNSNNATITISAFYQGVNR